MDEKPDWWSIYNYFTKRIGDKSRGKEYAAYASTRAGNAWLEIEHLAMHDKNSSAIPMAADVMSSRLCYFAIKDKDFDSARRILGDMIERWPMHRASCECLRGAMFIESQSYLEAITHFWKLFRSDVSWQLKAVCVGNMCYAGYMEQAAWVKLAHELAAFINQCPPSLLKAQMSIGMLGTSTALSCISGISVNSSYDGKLIVAHGCQSCLATHYGLECSQAARSGDWNNLLSSAKHLFQKSLKCSGKLELSWDNALHLTVGIPAPSIWVDQNTGKVTYRVPLDPAHHFTQAAFAVSEACTDRSHIMCARKIVLDMILQEHVPEKFRQYAQRLIYRWNGCIDVSPLETFEIAPELLEKLGEKIDLSELENLHG